MNNLDNKILVGSRNLSIFNETGERTRFQVIVKLVKRLGRLTSNSQVGMSEPQVRALLSVGSGKKRDISGISTASAEAKIDPGPSQ